MMFWLRCYNYVVFCFGWDIIWQGSSDLVGLLVMSDVSAFSWLVFRYDSPK